MTKWNKQEDRFITVRAEIAKAGRVAWHSPSRGIFNEGRNQAKRARRAVYFGQRWVNPRAMVARSTKPVRAAENMRRRAMTAKARAAA